MYEVSYYNSNSDNTKNFVDKTEAINFALDKGWEPDVHNSYNILIIDDLSDNPKPKKDRVHRNYCSDLPGMYCS